METNNANNRIGRLIPIQNWNDYHVWPPIGGLRHLVFNETKTGFNRCVIRIGRRVLIDENEFFKWAKEYNKLQSKTVSSL